MSAITNSEEKTTLKPMSFKEVCVVLEKKQNYVYRVVNRDSDYNNRKLNPLNDDLDGSPSAYGKKLSKQGELIFSPLEVARFARDVMKNREITLKILFCVQTPRERLLASMYHELQKIRELLEVQLALEEKHRKEDGVGLTGLSNSEYDDREARTNVIDFPRSA